MVTPVNLIFCIRMDDKPSKRPVGRPKGKVVRYYEVFNVDDIERESILRGDRERLLEATAARASQQISEEIIRPPKASKPRKAPKTSTERKTALVKGFGKLAPIIRAHLRNAETIQGVCCVKNCNASSTYRTVDSPKVRRFCTDHALRKRFVLLDLHDLDGNPLNKADGIQKHEQILLFRENSWNFLKRGDVPVTHERLRSVFAYKKNHFLSP